MRFAIAMGLFLLLFSAVSQAEVTEITLEVDYPEISVDDQGFTRVEIEGYQSLGDPGTPALPA